MKQSQHTRLCDQAKHWLLNTVGCSFALSELRTTHTNESPDAIGWKNGCRESYLIEVKTSRSDFFADRKKPFRKDSSKGMGKFRYFLAPPNLLKVDDLPTNWGLLEANKRNIRVIHGHHPKKENSDHQFSFTENNLRAEQILMMTILRRMTLQLGDLQGFTNVNVINFYSKIEKLKCEINEFKEEISDLNKEKERLIREINIYNKINKLWSYNMERKAHEKQ
ncbi:hypothetical protein [Zooshikella sp. RANM57]|uniref:hypothetical protein n=1 Tax=Zooshikella sp. RANM57 TaxID=3425863 RepID=UPI003D6E045A